MSILFSISLTLGSPLLERLVDFSYWKRLLRLIYPETLVEGYCLVQDGAGFGCYFS